MIFRNICYILIFGSSLWVSAQQANMEKPGSEATQGIENAVIYYLDIKTLKLVPQVRELLPTSSETNRIKQVIEWLSIPPEETGMMSIWPEIILLRDVFIVDDKTIVVDFNEELVMSLSSGVQLEGVLIHSLVNSLLESFPWYTEVWILRDGQVRDTFLGHVDTAQPLKTNTSLFLNPKPDLSLQEN